MARKKKLNIPLIKGVVMAALSLIIAFGFALAGIGAQVAAGPAIQFLLGFAEDRTKGTALAFALLAAVGGVIGFIVGGSELNFGMAVTLAVGATAGIIFTMKPATDPRFSTARRAGQSLGILVAIYVLSEGVRHRIGGPLVLTPEIQHLHPLFTGLLIGAVTGALSNLFQVAGGILLVPALIYLLGIDAPKAIATSLAVIAVASFLPALSYSSRGAVDRTMGAWMAAAGLGGGYAAGMVLSRLSFNSPLPYLLFGVIAMFLCAWRIWKMT